jgi:Aerotolerance regulator N-terminal/von Willebrand factor type A domain
MFLAPAFLLGLLAIGLPLWLHRMARDHRVRQQFPSLMFLEASETQHSSRRTLRYWLLLALRIALLALLALAFAEPLLSSHKLAAIAANDRLQAIVIDTSLSMQTEGRFDAAIAEAGHVLDQLKSSDRVMLVTADGKRVQVVQSAVNAREAARVRGVLRTLRPGDSRLDYGTLLSTTDNWLGTPRPPTVLHLITDGQASAMPLHFSDLALPAATSLTLHNVGTANVSNVYIREAQLTDLNAHKVTAAVMNDTDQPASREVALSVDGSAAGSNRLLIPSHQSASTEFVLEAPRSPVEQRLEFRLTPGDSLSADDRLFAVIDNAVPRIMVVASNTGSDEAIYLSAALESTGSTHLQIERVAANAVDVRSLSRYAALVIADSGTLSTDVTTAIDRYLRSGGQVFATVGERALSRKIEPLTQLAVRDSRNATSVASLDTSHPSLRDATGWSAVRIVHSAVVSPETRDRVLIHLRDGSPLLLERDMDAGRLILLTAPLDRDWNDLAIHPVFVRFIADLGRFLTDTRNRSLSFTVGAPVPTGLTAEAGGQIFDPQGQRVLELDELTGASRFTPGKAGFYEVRRSTGSRWLAINTDRRESDLTPISNDAEQQWTALPSKESTTPVSANRSEESGDPRQSIGLALLIVAAALLLLEALVANRHLFVRRESLP